MLSNITQGLPVLTDSEVQHVGEEIADVFIYSTRLCDVCGIDLGHSVACVLNDTPLSGINMEAKWRDISFDDIYENSKFQSRTFESQRQVALQLQAEVGKMASCFAVRSETFHAKGLVAWTESEKLSLSSIMGSICLLLCVLAKMTGLRIGQAIADKFDKNERKYPVALAKGSSAKYTAYANNSNSKPLGAPSSWNVDVKTLMLVAVIGLASFTVGRGWRP